MRTKVYNFLVNKHSGISYRYHKLHDGSTGVLKILSWAYLMWLNLCYYVFFCRFLGSIPEMEVYEQKRLNVNQSESEEYCRSKNFYSVSEYVEKLKQYDVISFDVFDTLIFRPMALPTDVFYLIGQKLDLLDFKNIRTWAEWDARVKCNNKNGHMEVTLSDIWKNLEEDTGLSAEKGMEIEAEIEQSLCYANPFMLEVWKELVNLGKEIIIVSDMYLPKDVVENILVKNGFTGAKNIFVSNEYAKNKASGTLFEEVLKTLKKEYKDKFSIIHVGDNPNSDFKKAKEKGFDVMPYQNVNKNILLYRPMDMSSMVGGAYRGLVSNYLYNGLNSYSIDYEYGYIYGGLFVVGYCAFIHEYCKTHQVDQILFLSRDGDTLMQAYKKLYPDDTAAYTYWSRKAATKLMANEDKHDFFRRFIYHKVNQKITIAQALHSMELDELVEKLGDWKKIWEERQLREKACRNKNVKVKEEKFIDLKASDYLTDKNGYLLRRFIEAKWDKVLSVYENQQNAAKKYYGEILKNSKRAVAIDIGWAGSGAMALSHLVKSVWKFDCELTGIIAGTNTVHNAEPDASDTFLQDGRLTAYLYSGMHNRDLLKKHNPSRDYNIFWELLLSSPTAQFAGFYEGKQEKNKSGEAEYREDLDITLKFGKYDYNQEGIKEIQRGILAFVDQYRLHFGDPENGEFSYMYRISGRDAYAPMLIAASHNEKYLKMIEKRFDLDINVT